MFYVLSAFVLLSPVVLAVVLTSHLSRRAKVLILAAYVLVLVIVPIAAVVAGSGAGV